MSSYVETVVDKGAPSITSDTSPKKILQNKRQKKTSQNEIQRLDILMLRMLVDYMGNGLVGPFQVIKETPSFYGRHFAGRTTVFLITGPDFVNRLRIEFNESEIANDICHALNRAFGYEELHRWSNKLEDQ